MLSPTKNSRIQELFKALKQFFSTFQCRLGPTKHRLVTYVQVNVYIGNPLSWLDGG